VADRKSDLLAKIESRRATIGVVGLGYVGLPLAVAFGKAGFHVIGVDVDAGKVDQLCAGKSYIPDVTEGEVAALVQSGRLRGSTHYEVLAEADAISICVPTPLRKTKDPDISYIMDAATRLGDVGMDGKLVVLESTTYPGTTEEIILPRLITKGAEPGKDFFLAFSPERIDPGRTDYTIWTTPKVLGGLTPDCLDTAVSLYNTIVQQTVPVSSPAAAEMVKLLENTFRAVNIAMINEVALMCNKLDLDVWEVIEAAATKPYGFMKFTPGPGVGGHCIPLDLHYLSWKLRTVNYTARFIELASDINSHMPEYVIGRIADALNVKRKPVNGSKLLVLGVAYKPNVGDVRESPALDVIYLLQERGADVSYHDPYVADLHEEGINLESIRLSPEALAESDCVVIITNHDSYDWREVTDNADLILDTRHALPKADGVRILSL